jgi:tRNA nucleotidyltransferase/poly(A) polymerase
MTTITPFAIRWPGLATVTRLFPEARFVGGCVRNALLAQFPVNLKRIDGMNCLKNNEIERMDGPAVVRSASDEPLTDFDMASPLTPDAVLTRAEAAGLTAKPTGLAHGTVTLVPKHGPVVELTTLRCDVSTDGRRATVAFTTDWAEDAARRDFTLNALYADGDGAVFDPLGHGLADCLARRVRFVGDPATRLAEDALRLLRFCRFHARYATGPLDAPGLTACVAAAPQQARLSGERIHQELAKLLVAPGAPAVWDAMVTHGVAAHVLPVPVAPVGRLARWTTWIPPEGDDWIARLALVSASGADPAALGDRLRLSNAEGKRLTTLLTTPLAHWREDRTRFRWLADHGPALATALIGLAMVTDGAEPMADIWPDPDHWPTLPITAKDLLALGHPPGPTLGAELRRLREAWITDLGEI